jgi:hypothetical protein
VVHGVNILHVSTTKNLESPMQYRDRSSGVYQTKDTKTSTRPSNEPSHKSFHEPCHEPSYESFHEPSHPKIKLKGYPKPTGIRARRGRDDDALSKTAKK